MSRSRVIQLMWAVAACGLFAAAGLLEGLAAEKARQCDFSPGGEIVLQDHPELALLTVVPGGLRAPAVAYLWIRANDLKEKGRYYDARQLASLICKLQPRFASVWAFHAWNMAWNISVATHTREERWLWVYNGVRLLRDEGIPMNPKALILYKELAWIYLSKMGQYLDNMHYRYKQKWAWEMQQLLAAPPDGETPEVIEAFRPIADAPLDKSRQGGAIQSDQRELLVKDPATAKYARRLGELGVRVDRSLLEAYNRYSRDDSVQSTRWSAPPEGANPREEALANLINSDDPADAAARSKLLAFVRAQILWNAYRMDPDWMLHLMEKYGPLDWRLVIPHGLYWVTFGLEVCKDARQSDLDKLNTERVLMNNLKELNWGGWMTYVDNPADPGWPTIRWRADWRYIPRVQKEYLRAIDEVVAHSQKEGHGQYKTVYTFRTNPLKAGHVNYLINAIEMLYAGYRRREAQYYFDWIKAEYGHTGGYWDFEDVGDFVIAHLNKEGKPHTGAVQHQLRAALPAALVALARGNTTAYTESLLYARKVYVIFQKDAPKRIKFSPFGDILTDAAVDMLVRPRAVGYNLSMEDRRELYRNLGGQIRLRVYDRAERALKGLCRLEKLDPETYFPPPAGLEQYRASRRARIPGRTQR